MMYFNPTFRWGPNLSLDHGLLFMVSPNWNTFISQIWTLMTPFENFRGWCLVAIVNIRAALYFVEVGQNVYAARWIMINNGALQNVSLGYGYPYSYWWQLWLKYIWVYNIKSTCTLRVHVKMRIVKYKYLIIRCVALGYQLFFLIAQHNITGYTILTKCTTKPPESSDIMCQ